MNKSISLLLSIFSVAILSFVGVTSVMHLCSYVAILTLLHSDFQFIGSDWAKTVAFSQATDGTKLRNSFASLIKSDVGYEFKFLFNLACELKKIYCILSTLSYQSFILKYGI